MSAALPVGTMLGEYRIEEQIGRGGMGVVYRATQVKLDRSVAIKVLAPELADDPDHRERFTREARHAAGLEHPNVVPVHATGEVPERDLAFLVMRYVPGTDLRVLIRKKGRLDPMHAATIVEQVAAALDAAHHRGLVHRDVKPANILISNAEREHSQRAREHVYLTDFGLTKALASEAGMTRSGMWVGTVDYIAPEQLKGGKVDGRADVYSLGCVLHETLTGEIPYPRDTEPAKMWAHISDDPPSPRSVSSDISEELDAVVQRATAKDPDDRFQTAGEMAEAALKAAHVYETRQSGAVPSLGTPAPPSEPVVPAGDPGSAPETKLRDPGAAPDAGDAAVGAPETAVRAPETEVAAAETALRAPEPAAAAPTAPPAGPAAPAPPAPVEPARPEPGAGEPPPAPVPRRSAGRSRTPLVAAVAAVLVAAVLAVVLLAGGGGSDGGKLSLRPPIPVGQRPADAVAVGGSVWVANQGDGTLTKIDAATGKPAGAPVKVVDSPYRLAQGDGLLWVISGSAAQATGINANTGGKGATVNLSSDPYDVAVGEGAVWIAANAAGPNDSARLIVLEPGTGDERSTLSLGASLADVATGHGSVWALDSDGGALRRISPEGRTEAQVPVGAGTTAIVTDDSAVWVAAAGQHRLLEIDPSTNKVVKRIALTNAGDVALVAGGGSLWWIDRNTGRVIRVDPKAGKAVGSPVKIGPSAGGAAVTDGTLWVTSPTTGSVVPVSF